jgi:DNA-directed RNA polymerase specialized sigma24 family protein
MGLGFLKNRQEITRPRQTDTGITDERFGAYFPRLFAYVRSCVGGDVPTQDIVVEAFTRAFSKAGGAGEDDFRSVLFRTARRLCRPALRHDGSAADDPLSPQEREVISLIFDAGLSREQISRMFRMRETTVNSALLTGLFKLKEQTSPAAAAAYPKLA